MGQGGLSRKAQQVQEDSRRKGIQGNTSREEIKCVCLNARSIINKKDELNIMVDDIKPHIIGITETWANNDITIWLHCNLHFLSFHDASVDSAV